LRVEDLADDPCGDLLAAEGKGDGVADGLAGLGETTTSPGARYQRPLIMS